MGSLPLRATTAYQFDEAPAELSLPFLLLVFCAEVQGNPLLHGHHDCLLVETTNLQRCVRGHVEDVRYECMFVGSEAVLTSSQTVTHKNFPFTKRTAARRCCELEKKKMCHSVWSLALVFAHFDRVTLRLSLHSFPHVLY